MKSPTPRNIGNTYFIESILLSPYTILTKSKINSKQTAKIAIKLMPE